MLDLQLIEAPNEPCRFEPVSELPRLGLQSGAAEPPCG